MKRLQALALWLLFAAGSQLALAEPAPPALPTSLPRPAADDANDKIRALFEAIVHDQPRLAADAFFPRDAFLQVKDIADPGRYYDQLRRRFDADIHALHASLPDLDHAVFERFELATRGGLVAAHEEGNRLPYWASRHSYVYFRSQGSVHKFEVRVMISWQSHWYLIHLSEFH
jgi:hypothetical protein